MDNIISENGASDSPPPQSTHAPDFLIVGIGASAGGIKALKDFFEQVPAESGMAYVVILHLSPEFESKLAEILQTVASIPVIQVQDEKVRVEPNRVYVIPPNKSLAMNDGHLELSPIQSFEERRAPVDIFFRTLAESHDGRAVSVILSGTGADGSMGMKRVKERGGIVIVQDPFEAEYADMPRNSLATELVDSVLPASEIPAQIIRYKESLSTVNISAETEIKDRTDDDQAALREVFAQLRARTKHDFSNYKRATVVRRLERRMKVRGVADLPAYVQLLREQPEETTHLLKDLLISVTNFFRDKEAFEKLERDVLPKILAGKTAADAVRVWVAGCATGEEAYSIAMLLAERTIGAFDAPSIQIFATDIDEAAIAQAREGFYTDADVADVSPERLRRFFTKEEAGWRVRREIRETVLFAVHNVIKDPPFSRLDLATCRNLLIYLNQTAQARVFETAHFALNPGGYLFLGSSESIDGSSNLFAAVDKESRIFQSRAVASRSGVPVPEIAPVLRFGDLRLSNNQPQTPRRVSVETQSLERLSAAALHQQLLETYAPPSLVVNENYDIIHISERAGRYLQIAGGEPSLNLLKVARAELRIELRTALYQAAQQNTNVETRTLKVKIDGHEETIKAVVRPVLDGGSNGNDQMHGYLLVVFEPAPESATNPSASEAVNVAAEPITQQLEAELVRTKAQLRVTIEQYEVQTEEFKASNEELQAINEELRSAAEELETSKEELQSLNEELSTVNQELKIKIEEVSQSNNDFRNLINSTDIGTIFLDRSFRVKLFTQRAGEIFNLLPVDIGRPLADINGKLDYDEIAPNIESVLEKLQTIEREISISNDRRFLMRVLPYRTAEDRIDGVVVTFFDITERKRAEEQVRASEARQAYLLKLSDAIRPLSDAVSITETVTRTAMNYFKADRCYYGEIEGDAVTIRRDAHREDLPSVANVYSLSETPLFKSVLQNGQPIVVRDVNASNVMDDALKQLCLSVNILSFINIPVLKDNQLVGNFCLTQCAARDWTSVEINFAKETAERTWAAVTRARAEEALARSEEKYRTLFDSMDEAYAVVEVIADETGAWNDFLFLEVNPAFEKQTGIEYPVGRRATELLDTPNPHWAQIYGRVAMTGEPVRIEEREEALGRTFDLYVFRLGGAGSRRVAVLFTDITERNRAEERLRDSEARFRAAFEQASVGIVQASLDGGILLPNPGFCKIIGYTEEEARRLTVRDITHPDDFEADMNQARRVIAGEIGGYSMEKRYLRKDGALVWVQMTTSLVRDTSGEPYYGLAIIEDITERKAAEDALRKSEERFRALIERSAEAITISERDGTIRFASPSIEAVSGYTPEEFVGRKPFVINDIHPDDLPHCQAAFSELLENSGRTVTIQHRYRHKSGEWRWLEGSFTSLFHVPAVAGLVANFRDITDRKFAEEAIRAGEERLRSIFESAQDFAIITLDTAGRITRWNRGAENIFGYTESEIIGQNSEILFTPEDRAANAPAEEIETARRTGRATDERWHLRKDNSRFFASGVMSRLRDGESAGFVKIARDLTLEKRAAEAMRESEERLRIVIEAAELATWDWDVSNDQAVWNKQHYYLYGIEPDDKPKSYEDFARFIHPDDLEMVHEHLQTAVEKSGIYQAEFRIIRADNHQMRWMSGYGRAVETDVNGRAMRMTGVMYDITERKKLETELERRVQERTDALAKANEQLQVEIVERQAAQEERVELLRQLVTTQEDERRRIARDLHDQLGQQLTALRLKLNLLKEKCSDENLCREVEQTQEIAGKLDSEVDFLAWELRPTALDDLGLVAALGNLVEEWSRHFGVKAEFQSIGLEKARLTPIVEINLYRIAQEALNNVNKHAAATSVAVLLERRDSHAVLIIEDNGVGFDTQTVAKPEQGRHIGLLGMRERAALIGGTLEIESTVDYGTTIFARVPLGQK